MNTLRLRFQWLLTALGLNDLLHLVQFCDRCGRSGRLWVSWWADMSLWEAVAGNVNGHHHGCYYPNCFDWLARQKGVFLRWKPEAAHPERAKPEEAE